VAVEKGTHTVISANFAMFSERAINHLQAVFSAWTSTATPGNASCHSSVQVTPHNPPGKEIGPLLQLRVLRFGFFQDEDFEP
jgi:hypothetical protein